LMTKPKDERPAKDLIEWLGITEKANWHRSRLLGGFIGVAFALMFGGALITAFGVLLHTLGQMSSSDGPGPNLGAGALIAAMLGAPFVIWGTVIKHKTLALSETSLFNDKVNAAVAALHSRRQVTREITVSGETKVLTEWQDDIVQRSGAIDRLEGLMRERPSEAPRIVNMLSVYVRELSREAGEDAFSKPIREHEAPDAPTLSPDVVPPQAVTRSAALRPFRADVEKAVQTLGRVIKFPNVDEEGIVLDLRGMDGRGFDLTGLTFKYAKLGKARLEETVFDRAFLGGVEMDSSTDLTSASLRGAALRYVDLTNVKISQNQLDQMFGDGSVKPLRKGLEWPPH
jgi:hypothetical protein